MFGIPYHPQQENQPLRKNRNRSDWDDNRSMTFRKKMFSPRLALDMDTIKAPSTFIRPEVWVGEGLFMYGKAGTGKTLYSAFLTEAIAAQLWINYHDKDINFISTPELFIRLKKSFTDPDTHDHQILAECTNPWLLVLDDFGVGGKPSEWVLENLYYLINFRYEKLLPTIITSNLSLPELAAMYGDVRITSRIQRMCKTAEKSHWKGSRK